ncbi:hypothetical protein NDU88_011270 [Pleurodeles waltl]|uniref:Uncharacterized protein n=1 Tax=Pleurodeles waltl TaxID=8319 RepID=A0AAV7R2K0_PLEWA|nr:hypothetical protein NDU88_011270 [Pleurodeles waltl]
MEERRRVCGSEEQFAREKRISVRGRVLDGKMMAQRPARARLCLCRPGGAQRTTLQARWGRPGRHASVRDDVPSPPIKGVARSGPSLPNAAASRHCSTARETGTRAPSLSPSPGLGRALRDSPQEGGPGVRESAPLSVFSASRVRGVAHPAMVQEWGSFLQINERPLGSR